MEDDWIFEDDDPTDDDYYEEDMAQSSRSAFYPLLKASALAASGINFTLLMEIPVLNSRENVKGSDHMVVPRYQQPCYGELRKYASTHPEECTQPKNSKPTDLWHPFPSGKPVAVSTNFAKGQYGPPRVEMNQMLTEMLDPEMSPWSEGIGNPELIYDGEAVVGVTMRDLRVDPTVLVNLFNNLKGRYSQSLGLAYTKLRDADFSPREAMAVMLLNNTYSPFEYIGQPDGYYTTKRLSLRRIIEAKPRDLSGGLLEDRIDYNRTELENVFMMDDKPSFSYKEELVKEGMATALYYGTPQWNSDVSEEDKIKAIRTVLSRMIESEAEPRQTKYDIEKGECILIEPVEEMKEAA